MKNLLLLLLLLPLAALSQDCPPNRYRQIMREANEATFGKKPDYQLAINKLLSAKTCQPDSEAVVNVALVRVFREVNRQRELAVENELEAKRQKAISDKAGRSSYNAALSFRTQKKDATLALRMADYNYKHHPNDPLSKSTYYDIATDPNFGFYESRFKVDQPSVINLKIHPNGRMVFTLTEGYISVWDLDGTKRASEPCMEKGNIQVSMNGLVFFINKSGYIEIRDSSLALIRKLEKETFLEIQDVSHDGNYLLVSTSDDHFSEQQESNLKLIDLPNDTILDVLSNMNKPTLAWSEGGFIYPDKDSMFMYISESNQSCLVDLNYETKSSLMGSGGGVPIVAGLNGFDLIGFSYNQYSLVNYGTVEIYIEGKKFNSTIFEKHVSKIEFTDGQNQCAVLSGGKVFLWNFYTDKIITIQNATSFDLSKDGKFLFTGDADGFVKKWYLLGFIEAKLPIGMNDHIIGTISSDHFLVSSNKEYFKIGINGEKSAFSPTKQKIRSVVFLEKQKYILALYQDSTLEIQNTDATTLYKHRLSYRPNDVIISPNEKYVCLIGKGHLELFEIMNSSLIKRPLPPECQETIVFSNDSKYFLSNIKPSKFAKFSITGKLLQQFDLKNNDSTELQPLHFSPDNQIVVAFSPLSNILGYWDINGQLIKQVQPGLYSPNFHFLDSGKYCFLSSYYGQFSYLCDFEMNQMITYPIGGVHGLNAVTYGNGSFTSINDNGISILNTPEKFIIERVFNFSEEELQLSGLKTETLTH